MRLPVLPVVVGAMDTYYTPRNPLVSALNALSMRRRFANTVDELLCGRKRSSKSRPHRSFAPEWTLTDANAAQRPQVGF